MDLVAEFMPSLKLKADDIRELYSLHKTAVDTRYRCEQCNVPESSIDGDLFKCCSRCHHAVYCSRKCQKKHWREHKKSCHRIATNDYTIMERLECFEQIYAPMLTMVSFLNFQGKDALYKNGTIISPATHAILIHVSDLKQQQLQRATMKPRLQIDEVEAGRFPNAPTEDEKEEDGDTDEKEEDGDTAFEVMTYILVYSIPGSKRQVVRPVIQPGKKFPSTHSSSSEEKLRYAFMSLEMTQAINDVASGKRPDLFAAMNDQTETEEVD